jgi:hypothetical protein
MTDTLSKKGSHHKPNLVTIELEFEIDVWGIEESIPQELIDRMMGEIQEERNALIKEAKFFLLTELTRSL